MSGWRQRFLEWAASDHMYRVMLTAICSVSFATVGVIAFGWLDIAGYLSRVTFALLCLGLLLRHTQHRSHQHRDSDG